MGKPINPQMHLGEIDIGAIQFDLRSRGDISRLLRGFQHLYINPELRQAVFAELRKIIPGSVDKNNGQSGMDLWRILVFSTLRLVINCDFDRLVELVNEHGKLRQILGHGPYDEYRYRLQTLQDNLVHFTPEVLDQVGLTCRRVFDNEKPPHSEKTLPYHKPCTEWISKDKAGVPGDQGLHIIGPVRLSLYHRVMRKETDSKVII